MLDVLITISESTPRQYVNECRLSVAAAIALAGYPVRHIEVSGVPGHIGRARCAGLNKSTAEYIAFVDDDDFVLPNAFSCLVPHFAMRPQAICARELQLLANGSLVPNHKRHHLTAFCRDLLEPLPLEDYPAYDAELMHGAYTEAIDVMQWVYVRRRYLSAGLALRTRGRPSP